MDSIVKKSQCGPVQESHPSPVPESRSGPVQESRSGPLQESRPGLLQESRPCPPQESRPGPCKPKLIGLAASDDSEHDTEVDDSRKTTTNLKSPSSSLENSSLSPKEQNEDIRIKRLIRRAFDQTGKGPFEVASMVKHEKYDYGVVKYIGDWQVEGEHTLMAGVDFVSSLAQSLFCTLVHILYMYM